MPNLRFYPKTEPIPLSTLVNAAAGSVTREQEGLVQGISDMPSATSKDIVFYDNQRFREQLRNCKAGFCLTRANLLPQLPEGMVGIVVKDPKAAFAKVAAMFHPDTPQAEFHAERIHPSAEIDPSAKISSTAIIGAGAKLGKNVTIGHQAVIQNGAEIADGSVIGAHTTIGRGVQLGPDAHIGDHCTIEFAIAGKNLEVQHGTRIGITGYGYERKESGFERTPQLGCVVLGDNVGIDANCVIEKGALSDTHIGDGTKIGSQVMIGHNVRTGKNCLILAQAGIAGSTTLGDNVIIAPQAGIRDHVTIGDNVQIAPQSGVANDIPANTVVEGTPAAPIDRRELVRRRRGQSDERGGP